MKVVFASKSDIIRNLQQFEEYLNSNNEDEQQFAFARILAGQNFIAYTVAEEIHFCPSKWVGYKNASIETWGIGNGGSTNINISSVLKHEMTAKAELDALYYEFVEKYKMGKPHDKKTNPRKFWKLGKKIQPTLSLLRMNFDAEVQKALQTTKKERAKRLKAARRTPKKRTIQTTYYSRNADVVAEVLERANGKCENCRNDVPLAL